MVNDPAGLNRALLYLGKTGTQFDFAVMGPLQPASASAKGSNPTRLACGTSLCATRASSAMSAGSQTDKKSLGDRSSEILKSGLGFFPHQMPGLTPSFDL